MADGVVVYVHGICPHRQGYSLPWWRALSPHLGEGYETAEVLWSDVVRNDKGGTDRRPADQVRSVIEDRSRRQAVRSKVEPAAAYVSAFRMKPMAMLPMIPEKSSEDFLGIPGMGCFDDVAAYLTNFDVRSACVSRFVEVVRPLLDAGKKVSVIAHSWGCVVSYEALRYMAAGLSGRYMSAGSSPKVSNLITAGCPMSIGILKKMVAYEGSERPSSVRRWVNVEAKFDVVGGSLSGMYGVDAEYLGLEPVGCSSFIPEPVCAHASYFRPDNVAVNRDVFAAEILSAE